MKELDELMRRQQESQGGDIICFTETQRGSSLSSCAGSFFGLRLVQFPQFLRTLHTMLTYAKFSANSSVRITIFHGCN